MSKVQVNLPVAEGTATLPATVQDDPSTLITQGEPGGTGQSAMPDEHSLLSRPVAPQGRRSLFRR